jgi:hypothetical protein
MSSARVPPATKAEDDDLLVRFEQEVLPAEYKTYYRTKRNNFFASIQKFPELWNYYLMLDAIWYREIDLLKPSAPNKAFPIMLYINAHAKLRIAVELAFTGCLPEARSILRDAAEFVAHAHHMLKDPALQVVWLNRLDDDEAFMREFWHSKQTGLFAGLDELYEMWRKLSEMGSHANITSICERVKTTEVDGQPEWRLSYTGVAEKPWAMGIFDMLLVDFKMEETLFRDYEMRFQFDEKLLTMHRDFENYKERLRRALLAKYNVKPPETPMVVLK